MRPFSLRALAATIALAVCASACAQGTPSAPPATLTIFAASSLKDALVEVKRAYEATHPGTTLVVTTDSSAALAAKIEQGASADAFLSADTSNPQRLLTGGFATGDPVVFAGNELVIVIPAAIPSNVEWPIGLLTPGMKIIAAGEDVPITKYVDQVLDMLAKLPSYPPDFAARYAANVVSREENVRAVLAKIELGEGDAAIVYATDARASKDVATIQLPAAANVRATYAGVVVRASKQAGAAADFLDWLTAQDAQLALGRFGFLPPA
jgi:molybdate transport system substrate-binding protein